jgi:hypothetical protein
MKDLAIAIEKILSDADALIRRRIKALGIEAPHVILALAGLHQCPPGVLDPAAGPRSRLGLAVCFFGGLGPTPSPLVCYLPLRASRRPSSVNAALRSSSLPLVPSRTTHPHSTARSTVARNSPRPRNVAHCIGCPSVTSYSL